MAGFREQRPYGFGIVDARRTRLRNGINQKFTERSGLEIFSQIRLKLSLMQVLAIYRRLLVRSP
jgi:hypothetical protein